MPPAAEASAGMQNVNNTTLSNTKRRHLPPAPLKKTNKYNRIIYNEMIEIKNLKYKYAGAKSKVFDGLDLTLGEGNVYGLLGKNGTGKSTLLYLICGLLRKGGGSVTFDGTETSLHKAELLEEMFLVPEEFDLPSMTLDAYVRTNKPFYPHFSMEILEKCLTDFELPYNLKLNSLSMGQKKKVYMSFALATGTKVLIMDEPTNGLDIPSKSQFRKVVANNMSEDRIIVISTHQVHDVEALLDHIIILDHSDLLLDSSVSDICNKYSFEYRGLGEPSEDVLYAEPSMQGNAVITRKKAADEDTQLNLELLFNAITKKEITF